MPRCRPRSVRYGVTRRRRIHQLLAVADRDAEFRDARPQRRVEVGAFHGARDGAVGEDRPERECRELLPIPQHDLHARGVDAGNGCDVESEHPERGDAVDRQRQERAGTVGVAVAAFVEFAVDARLVEGKCGGRAGDSAADDECFHALSNSRFSHVHDY